MSQSSRRLLWSIAWRFLRGRRSRLLDGTAKSALVATTLGVTSMVIAMALMSGYREDLQSKLVRGNAAILAYPLAGAPLAPESEAYRELLAIPEVTQVRPVVYGQGSLISHQEPDGIEVTLRGIDAIESLGELGSGGNDAGPGRERDVGW